MFRLLNNFLVAEPPLNGCGCCVPSLEPPVGNLPGLGTCNPQNAEDQPFVWNKCVAEGGICHASEDDCANGEWLLPASEFCGNGCGCCIYPMQHNLAAAWCQYFYRLPFASLGVLCILLLVYCIVQTTTLYSQDFDRAAINLQYLIIFHFNFQCAREVSLMLMPTGYCSTVVVLRLECQGGGGGKMIDDTVIEMAVPILPRYRYLYCKLSVSCSCSLQYNSQVLGK